jgi:hypothetical protein
VRATTVAPTTTRCDVVIELCYVMYLCRKMMTMYYCLEGIPQHAWYKDLANSIFGDDVVIHHVEEETRRKLDHRAYSCFTFSKDPSKITQMVFLTLTE